MVQFLQENGERLGNAVEGMFFANTKGLQSKLERNVKDNRGFYMLSVRDICRLHQRDECHFGGDCTRIHICRKIAPALNLPPVPRKVKEDVHVQQLPRERNVVRAIEKKDLRLIMPETYPKRLMPSPQHQECSAPPRNACFLRFARDPWKTQDSFLFTELHIPEVRQGITEDDYTGHSTPLSLIARDCVRFLERDIDQEDY